MSGCEIASERRKHMLAQVLNDFGVEVDQNNALLVKASDQDFARKKHFLLQAIMAVNDFVYLAKLKL